MNQSNDVYGLSKSGLIYCIVVPHLVVFRVSLSMIMGDHAVPGIELAGNRTRAGYNARQVL